MKRWLTCGVGLLMGCAAGPAVAQPSALPDSDYARLGRPVAAAPAAALGRPRAAADPAPPPEPVRPVAYETSSASPAALVFRGQAANLDDPAPFSPPDDGYSPRTDRAGSDAEERYLRGEPQRSPTYRPSDRRYNHTTRFGEMFPIFGDHPGDPAGHHGSWFESDHCFEYMISPVTNPFLFEDPRSVTEIRPIFLYQRIPTNNAVFRGGNAEFLGTQLRIAFSDRFSFVVHELGGVAIHPGADAQVPGGTGFAEVHLGPKFTFLRDVQNRFVGAMGLIFEIPTGRASVYQDTGHLSLVPYLSLAKNFFETSWGSINVMDTFGYSFATDSQRTNFVYNSLHVDYDVLNRHCFFPLVELNWFNYTRSGTVNPFGTEGADLANIGSMGVSGKNNLNLALGARYKFSEHVQVGTAVEFPLLNRRDLNNFRWTVDMIWRY